MSSESSQSSSSNSNSISISISDILSKLPSQWHPATDNSIPTLYWFPLSQPSRAVAQLLEEGSINHKKIVIDIAEKHEHKDPLYIKFINPAGLVPVLYKPKEHCWMNESNNIMKYLINLYPEQLSNFYPKTSSNDFKAINRIESQLNFISSKVRPISTGLLVDILVLKDKYAAQKKFNTLVELLNEIESRFEKSSEGKEFQNENENENDNDNDNNNDDNLYFCGGLHPTIADFQLYHEIVATKDIGYFPWDENKYFKLTKWYKNMQKRPATKKVEEEANIKNITEAVKKSLEESKQ